MPTEKLINRDEKHGARAERGGQNLPMAAGGVSSGTARRGNFCPATLDLMEAFVCQSEGLDEKRHRRSPCLAIGYEWKRPLV